MADVIEENYYYKIIKAPRVSSGRGYHPDTLNFGQILYARGVSVRSFPSLGQISTYTGSLNKYSLNKPNTNIVDSDYPYYCGGLSKSHAIISDVKYEEWSRYYQAAPYWTDNSSIYSLQNSWSARTYLPNGYSFYNWYGYAHGDAVYTMTYNGSTQSHPVLKQNIEMVVDGTTQAHFHVSGFFLWANQSAENITGVYPDEWTGSIVDGSTEGSGLYDGDINRRYFYNEAGVMGLKYCFGTINSGSSIRVLFVITSLKRTYGCILSPYAYMGSDAISKDGHIDFYTVDKVSLFSGYNYNYSEDKGLLSKFANDESLTCTLVALFDGGNNSSLLVSLNGLSDGVGSLGGGADYYPLVYFSSATVTIGCYHDSYSSSTDHALYFFVDEITAVYSNQSGYIGEATFSINYDGSTTGGGQQLPINKETTSCSVNHSTTITTTSLSEWTSTPSTTKPRLIAVWTSADNMPSTYAVNFSISAPYNNNIETAVSSKSMTSGTIVFDVPNQGVNNTVYKTVELSY